MGILLCSGQSLLCTFTRKQNAPAELRRYQFSLAERTNHSCFYDVFSPVVTSTELCCVTSDLRYSARYGAHRCASL